MEGRRLELEPLDADRTVDNKVGFGVVVVDADVAVVVVGMRGENRRAEN